MVWVQPGAGFLGVGRDVVYGLPIIRGRYFAPLLDTQQWFRAVPYGLAMHSWGD